MNKILIQTLIIFALLTTGFSDCTFEEGDECTTLGDNQAINPIKWNSEGTEGGYVEQLTVRVLDEKNRVVPGALVNVTWEITRARGEATTKTLATDENGRVRFTLTNLEFDPKDTNLMYTVRAGYSGKYLQTSFEAQNKVVERTMVLPLYEVIFRVRDKNYRAIEGVTVVVDEKYSKKTDKNGIASLFLGKGTHVASPQYQDIEELVNFTVNDDTRVDIMLTLYDLSVKVVDDNGNPLIAQVHVGGQKQTSGSSGWANFTNITTPDVVVYSTYGRYKKSVSANLERSDVLLLAFDSTPPIIEDVNVKYTESHLQINAVVRDIGEYASGFSSEQASVDLFYIGADNIQRSLPMYSIGYGVYESLISTQQGQKTIRYTIQATDSDGNSASNTDTFVLPAAEPTGFEDSQSQPPASVISEQFNFDWTVLPIIALVGVAAAAGGYWYYTSKKLPSQQQEEEPPNPQAETQEYTYDKKTSLDSIPKKDGTPKPPNLPN